MPRLKLRNRRKIILAAALKLAGEPGGWAKLTRAAIAREARCSDALINVYFESMAALKRTLIKTADKTENISILVQAHFAGDLVINQTRWGLLTKKAFAAGE